MHAAQVLLYHLVPNVAARSSDLRDGQALPTAEGQQLTVRCLCKSVAASADVCNFLMVR